MRRSGIAADLAELLGSVRRPGDFHASGTVALLPPSLEVDGVGRIALPLLPVQAEQLVAAAEPAPFGRGEGDAARPGCGAAGRSAPTACASAGGTGRRPCRRSWPRRPRGWASRAR